MLTYQDVITIDTSKLTTMAAAWSAMADEFPTLLSHYNSKVAAVTKSGEWTGDSADAARESSGITQHELSAAESEARAVAKTLRQAHTNLNTLIEAVKKEVQRAKDAGMFVDHNGIARFDYDNATEAQATAARHDPNLATTENTYSENIKEAIKAVDDYDHDIRVALNDDVKDKDGKGEAGGFNGAADGDIAKAAARRFDRLATELDKKGELSDAKMHEMRVLARSNSDDEVFAKTMLDGLGPKTTLSVADIVAEEVHKGNKQFAGLDHDLANSLAVATKDTSTPFYKKWRKGMRNAGVEMISGGDKPALGYQSLVTLMKKGSGYSKQFLSDVGDDIISAEKKNPAIWDMARSTQNDLNPKHYKWLEPDPLDGLLGVMGKEPKAATYFLDPAPGTDHENGHLKYLLSDRDWQKHYYYDGMDGIGHPGDVEDPNSRKGLGAALEAASTGHRPGVTPDKLGQHSEAQARVMNDTIALLDKGKHGDDLPANLRKPLGHMLVDYTPDTHETLSLGNPAYNDIDKGGKVWDDDGTVRMGANRDQLLRVMRGVSDDPAAYADMFDAERQYASDTFAGEPMKVKTPDQMDHRDKLVEKTMTTFGAYDGIQADKILDNRDDAIQWARDVNRHAGSAGGATLNFVPAKALPGVDTVNRLVDLGTYDWMKNQIADASEAAAHGNSHVFNTGRKQADDLILQWGVAQGLADVDADGNVKNVDSTVEHLTEKAKDSHQNGFDEAKQPLGRPD